jgi:hypothetical protein
MHMGKAATYRKRGTHAAAATPDLRPPAPALNVVAANLIQAATGNNDEGGEARLYSSPTGTPPWTQTDSDAWDWVVAWGPVDGFPPAFYAATEIGNGSTYIGESDRSNIIHLPL